MLRKTLILAIIILSGLIAAYGLTPSPKKAASMTDKELQDKIDSLARLEQPLTAAPYIAEAKKRAKASRDTRWMFDLIRLDIELNSARRSRETSPEEEYKKALADAWMPLAQAINLSLYNVSADEKYLEASLSNPDTLMAASAKEIGAKGWMASRNALDFIVTSIAMSNRCPETVKESAVNTLASQARAHADNLSLVIATTLQIVTSEAAADSLLDTISATTPDEIALVDFARAAIILGKAKEAYTTRPSAREIAETNAIVDKAKELLRDVHSNLPETPFAAHAQNILNQLDEIFIEISTNDQILPGTFIPVYLKYRNINDIELRVYNVKGSMPSQREKQKDFLIAQKLCSSSKISLPATNTCLEKSSAYVELAAVATGNHAIAAFHGDTLLAAATTLSSQISVDKIDQRFLVADFKTGKPLPEALVDQRLHPDANGWTPIIHDNTRHASHTITLGSDSFRFNVWNDSYYININKRGEKAAKVFTDRAIYRPGQTISYKAFVFTSFIDHVEPAISDNFKIVLSASNGKELFASDIKTDSLGTAHGEIDIPDDAFKGAGYISIKDKRVSLCWQRVRIEDFKRTDNTLTINPFTEAYLPGATVTVSGAGSSAAGLPVANATLEYTVSKQGAVVANGTTSTDDNGLFDFSFKTSDQKAFQYYDIDVRMTDLKGETTSGQRHCRITSHGSQISLSAERSLSEVGHPLLLQLGSHNSNDQPFASTVHLTVTPFSPSAPLRPRANHDSDTSLTHNPNLVWRPDGNSETLAPAPCAERDFKVDGTLSFDVNELSLAPGKYLFRISATALDGSELTQQCNATIIASEGASPNLNYLDIVAPDEAKSGEKLTFKVCTGLQDAVVNVVLALRGNIVLRQSVNVSCGVRNVTFNVPDDAVDNETLIAYAFTAKDGCHYSDEQIITLRHVDRQVSLCLKTFRDHSRPGASETWRLSSDGAKSIFASMYDSRLDKYVNNQWYPVFNRLAVPNNLRHWHLSHSDPYSGLYDSTGDENIEFNSSGLLNNIFRELTFDSPLMSDDIFGWNFVGCAPRMFKSARMNTLDMAESMACLAPHETEEVCAEDAEAATGAEGGDGGDNDVKDLREDFSETVFFMPQLKPDSEGNATFSFTLPDNLTTYRFRAIGFDKDLHTCMTEQLLTVNKSLNVRMGAPRFLTEQDVIDISADVTAADSTIPRATLSIVVTDPTTGRAIATLPDAELSFANSSAQLASWRLEIPLGIDSIQIDIVAKAEGASDGERRVIPVKKRFDEVEESHTFTLIDKGQNVVTNPFTDGKTSCLSFSYTSNAFIEVLRALPSLDNSWYPSTDTYLGRYETSAIAAMLCQKPDIRQAVDYLEKNAAQPDAQPRIDDAENTPWLYMARRLHQHDIDVVRIMNRGRAESTKSKSIAKLARMQCADGSFPWFSGMEGSPWMTAGVVATIGEMIRLGIVRADEPHVGQICKRALPYLDNQIKQYAKDLKKGAADAYTLGLDFLYARILVSPKTDCNAKTLVDHLADHWQTPSMTDRVKAVTILTLANRHDAARQIVKSLEENLVHTKDGTAYIQERGLYRRRAEVEAQAMLIMTLQRLNPQSPNLPKLINHLILMKRGEAWPDAQSTSRAVLALLASSATSVASTDQVEVADTSVTLAPANPKTIIPLPVNTKSATVTKSNALLSWGGWQRTILTAKDQMPADGTDKLKISRSLEVRRIADNQVKWTPLAADDELAIGDQIRVTLKFYNDEPLSFVRVSDFRPAAFEPDDKLSGYHGWWWSQWTDVDTPTPPHYMAIADNSADFFIDYLNSGWHSISYTLTVTNSGHFASGYADAVCLYETDIRAHTEGLRLRIGRKTATQTIR